MIEAFHSLWTKPYLATNNKKEYDCTDFNLLINIISALKWRQKNGKIKLITDKQGVEFVKRNKIQEIYDGGIFCDLDDIPQEIDPLTFWAAGKIFALKSQNVPICMIDTDMIVWNEIYDKLNYSSVIHFEEIDPLVYPSSDYFDNPSFFKEYSDLDWSVLPSNTAFMYIDNKKLKEYYVDASIEFMTTTHKCNSRIIEMVFAEQRLFSMCAKKLDISINSIYSIDDLFSGKQQDFTHVWGQKQILENNFIYRHNFCLRCINRILSDFKEYEHILADNPKINKYYKEYIQNSFE